MPSRICKSRETIVAQGGETVTSWHTSAIVIPVSEETLMLAEESRTDKSKITRKQSKASKHGHENQKSTKPKPQKTKALANFHLQGPILQFPKVLCNFKRGNEREGPNVQSSQTTTVLTVKI
ncbi:hypothetical protein Tco_1093327 [Tanacetum coccineum]|uniref:Uncharacterized protein n=1 Tax=Tanacetum coccineum TaxID=301880 RepID=A0ABQ5ICC7_9ASTR